jgi:hypothetical protein
MKRFLFLLSVLFLVALVAARSPHAADHKKPTITITTPTTATTYATTATPLTVGGTASDNVGVTSVTWVNAAGGSGTATGTTTWSASIALTLGTNLITVTAHDAAGNTGTDALTVTRMTQPGPITVEWTYSGAGDAFQMERCTLASTCDACTTFTSVAAIAIGDRSWTDTAVTPTDDYRYRMAVTTGGTLGTYSNAMCSP